MASKQKPLCIIGAGGFGREVLGLWEDVCRAKGLQPDVVFAEEDNIHTPRVLGERKVELLSSLDYEAYIFVIAIADVRTRQRIATAHPKLNFTTLIHPTAVLGRDITIGPGSIICAGCILTCDISFGRHTHLNLATTVGHNTTCGDFLTTAPGARISGRCTLGTGVHLATGAMLRDGIRIGNNVLIGMGGVVVSDILEQGTYVGVPARRLR